jgi:hypothetical protein
MSLRSNIAGELQRTPVAAISAAAGVVVASLSLGLAWHQYQVAVPQGAPTGSASVNSHPPDLALGNILLTVAYFLAATISVALFLRMLGRKHDLTALFGSVPLVALSNFSAILVLYLAPPRPLTRQLFASAQDLVFYSAAAIVIAFCGRAVLRYFAETALRPPASDTRPDRNGSDGIGLLIVMLLVLAIWSWLVFAGQTHLTRTLLPEVAHPAASQAPKAGTLYLPPDHS